MKWLVAGKYLVSNLRQEYYLISFIAHAIIPVLHH